MAIRRSSWQLSIQVITKMASLSTDCARTHQEWWVEWQNYKKITLKWINRPSKLSYCQVMTSCYECTGTCSSSVKTFVWSHFDKQQTILANIKILFSFCFWLYTNILTLGAWCLQIFSIAPHLRWQPWAEPTQALAQWTLTTLTGNFNYLDFLAKWFFVTLFRVKQFFSWNHFSNSAFSAGTCNLDSASGAIHPTTGRIVIVIVIITTIIILQPTTCCIQNAKVYRSHHRHDYRRLQLLHDSGLPLGADLLLWRPGHLILL